jgi:hypothetical protein
MVAARAVTPEPDLFADEAESESLVLASLPEPAIADTPEPYKVSPRGTRFYVRSTFAAVPSAGLTTQTP